ncbi:acyl-CoA N-acyltransferase [Thermoascus aurantiacus ATCC 26904]
MSSLPPNLDLHQHPPPGPSVKLTYPTPSNPNPPSNPPLLTDALRVRHAVFVEEQGCSADNELDADDGRSWHWVLYLSSEEGGKVPIGVIRLVPPPHAPHESLTHPESTSSSSPKYDLDHEPYIKLTRVAVLPAYRGQGLARKLVEAALEWAAQHPEEIDAAYDRVLQERTQGQTQGKTKRWTGLALVHAQVAVEGMYAKLGFVTDAGLGRWLEEGIEHVGMWRRVPVRS